MKPICTVLVGLPALGKSTYVEYREKIYKAIGHDYFVYSTDYILGRIATDLCKTYDDVFEKHIKDAQTEADIFLADAIKHKIDVIWDQTNLGVKKRKKIVNKMTSHGYDVECTCILPPEDCHISDQKEWKYRLASRTGKTIPQNILTNMIKSFTVPTVDEGFSKITFLNMYDDLVGIEYGK